MLLYMFTFYTNIILEHDQFHIVLYNWMLMYVVL